MNLSRCELIQVHYCLSHSTAGDSTLTPPKPPRTSRSIFCRHNNNSSPSCLTDHTNETNPPKSPRPEPPVVSSVVTSKTSSTDHHHHHLSFIRSSVEDRVDLLVHLVPRGAETSAKGLVQQPSESQCSGCFNLMGPQLQMQYGELPQAWANMVFFKTGAKEGLTNAPPRWVGV